MRPYLDLFLTVVVLESGTSGDEAAGWLRSVVGGIEVKMLGRKFHGSRLCSLVVRQRPSVK